MKIHRISILKKEKIPNLQLIKNIWKKKSTTYGEQIKSCFEYLKKDENLKKRWILKSSEIISKDEFFIPEAIKLNVLMKHSENEEDFVSVYFYIDGFNNWLIYFEKEDNSVLNSKKTFDKIFQHNSKHNDFFWYNDKENYFQENIVNFISFFWRSLFNNKEKNFSLSWTKEKKLCDIFYTFSFISVEKNILDEDLKKYILKVPFLEEGKNIISVKKDKFFYSYRTLIFELNDYNDSLDTMKDFILYELALQSHWTSSKYAELNIEDLFIKLGKYKDLLSIKKKYIHFLKIIKIKLQLVKAIKLIRKLLIEIEYSKSKLTGIPKATVEDKIIKYYNKIYNSTKIEEILSDIKTKKNFIDDYDFKSKSRLKSNFKIISLLVAIIFTISQFINLFIS